MTQKDLLYLEDAYHHEQDLINICTYYEEILENNSLKTFIKNEIKKHENFKNKLFKTMEDIANE